MALSKNSLNKISFLITLFIVISLTGCLSEWQGQDGLAKIVISFGSANRAVFNLDESDPDFTYDPNDSQTHQKLEHKIVLTSATEIKPFEIKGSTTFEAYVAPGEWNVLVYSYLGDNIYAAGSKDVVLKLGQDNKEIIAMYQAHIVKFISGEGSEVPDKIVIHGKPASPPTSPPTRRGYEFTGWFTSEDFDEPFNFTIPITQNYILYAYAKWEKITDITGDSLAKNLKWLSDNALNGNYYFITIDNDENLPPQTLSYDGIQKVTITLTGGDTPKTISLPNTSQGSLFTVGSGVTLILGNNVTLKGHRNNNESLITINSGGTLEMNAGSKITGNSNLEGWQAGVYIQEGAKFTMNEGVISDNTAQGCGGVKVEGTFIMKGGEISRNKANGNSGGGVWIQGGTFTMSGTAKISGNIAEGDGGGESGGVHMYKDNGQKGEARQELHSGTFIMNGGEISGNTAQGGGGVSIHYGEFTMSGTAKISGNTAEKWDGGGVIVYENSTFTMTGGEISNNTVNYGCGGGVLVKGTFTMSNTAKISKNKVIGMITDSSKDKWNAGGGVCVYSGNFTMEDGEISENKVSGREISEAGGIFVGDGTFTMKSGTISGNTATNGGGGVKIANQTGKFTMENGKIINNTSRYGGGVNVGGGGSDNFGGTFIMENGEISNNTATNADNSSGGGVNVSGNKDYGFEVTFTMKGGKISENKVEGTNPDPKGWYVGGGVNVYMATFNMSGGEIFGNTAKLHGGGVCVSKEGTLDKSNKVIANGSGTIYGCSPSNNDKSNESQKGTGHAVYVEGYNDDAKYKNSNVTGNMTLFYSGTSAPTFSGAWDNLSINVTIVNMDEWETIDQTTIMDGKINESQSFTVVKPYANYKWYLNGDLQNSVSTNSYQFTPTAIGTYEVAVVVENASGEKRSGSCQVIVK